MKRQIKTPEAPEAVGAYSQGIISAPNRPLFFTAGQIALTKEGTLVEGGVEDQTYQVMENLKAVLGAAGCRLADVLKTQIFIADMGLAVAVNRVYAEYFEGIEPPARDCLIALPPYPGALVEASMIAQLPETA